MTAEVDPSLPHYAVRVFLSDHERKPSSEWSAEFAAFAGLPVGPAYSTDLNVIVAALRKTGWWWHLSHLEAVVIPTKDVEGMEGLASNSANYDREGRPIRYTAHFPDERPAQILCEAWLKAQYDLPAAFAVQASARENAANERPRSRESMMAYYKAREDNRQHTIDRLSERFGPVPENAKTSH